MICSLPCAVRAWNLVRACKSLVNEQMELIILLLPHGTLSPSQGGSLAFFPLDFLAPYSAYSSLGQMVESLQIQTSQSHCFCYLFLEKYQVVQSVSMGKWALPCPIDGELHLVTSI